MPALKRAASNSLDAPPSPLKERTKLIKPLPSRRCQALRPNVDWRTKYLYIAPAGSGDNGDTFFALPRSCLLTSGQRHTPICEFEKSPSDALQTITALTTTPRHPQIIPTPALHSLSSKLVVIKTLHPSSQSTHEITTLQRLRPHPRLPLMLDHDPLRSSWCAMPPIRGGTLSSYILTHEMAARPVPEVFVWHVFIQLVEAIQHIHGHRIAHCDVTGNNVMLDLPGSSSFASSHCIADYSRDSGEIKGLPNIKLIDFGWAEHFHGIPKGSDAVTDRLERFAMAKDVEMVGDLVHELAHAEVWGAKARDWRTGGCGCGVTTTCDGSSKGAGKDDVVSDLWRRAMRMTSQGVTGSEIGLDLEENYCLRGLNFDSEDPLGAFLEEIRKRGRCLIRSVDVEKGSETDILGDLSVGGPTNEDVLAAVVKEMQGCYFA